MKYVSVEHPVRLLYEPPGVSQWLLRLTGRPETYNTRKDARSDALITLGLL